MMIIVEIYWHALVGRQYCISGWKKKEHQCVCMIVCVLRTWTSVRKASKSMELRICVPYLFNKVSILAGRRH